MEDGGTATLSLRSGATRVTGLLLRSLRRLQTSRCRLEPWLSWVRDPRAVGWYRRQSQRCPTQKRFHPCALLSPSWSALSSVDLAAHCCHTTLSPILVAAHCCHHHAVVAAILICSDPSLAGLAAHCCRHHGQCYPPQKRSIAVAAMVSSCSKPCCWSCSLLTLSCLTQAARATGQLILDAFENVLGMPVQSRELAIVVNNV